MYRYVYMNSSVPTMRSTMKSYRGIRV